MSMRGLIWKSHLRKVCSLSGYFGHPRPSPIYFNGEIGKSLYKLYYQKDFTYFHLVQHIKKLSRLLKKKQRSIFRLTYNLASPACITIYYSRCEWHAVVVNSRNPSCINTESSAHCQFRVLNIKICYFSCWVYSMSEDLTIETQFNLTICYILAFVIADFTVCEMILSEQLKLIWQTCTYKKKSNLI